MKSVEMGNKIEQHVCEHEDNEASSVVGKPNLESYTFIQRVAARMARSPKTFLFASLLLSVSVSVLGIMVGGLPEEATQGWTSRRSFIADRHTQLLLTLTNAKKLVTGDIDTWDDLINNIQPDWETGREQNDEEQRRLKEGKNEWKQQVLTGIAPRNRLSLLEEDNDAIAFRNHKANANSTVLREKVLPLLVRRLEPTFFGCNWGWYLNQEMTKEEHLWPVWKTKNEEDSFLDANVIEELCMAEQETQRYLEDNNMCFGCNDGCLPPYSIIFYIRLLAEDGMKMDCSELSEFWDAQQKRITANAFETCAEELLKAGDLQNVETNCGSFLYPSLFDEFFTSTGKVQYTSSIFATKSDKITLQDMYDNVESFDRGGNLLEGSYDTQNEEFVTQLSDGAVNRDMGLATGSAIITAGAILIHTRSPFLTLIGLVQIMLSLPLAYSVYTIFFGFSFFPFLNFIGVFVVFALGADHIFVAVDKWKNARIEKPLATTEEIAALALPDAAGAMFLTTSTTSVAFFGTAICRVAPIKLFAVFCGLLIALDYIICILLIFPALAIYDRNIEAKSSCTSCCYTCFQKPQVRDEEKPSLIRRILLAYYDLMHSYRWPLLIASIISLAVSSYYASKLSLPTNSEVRLLGESNQFEQAYMWRQNLFREALGRKGGSTAFFIWGTTPADTGDHNNPKEWSQLVLDETFDPSSTNAQLYLRDFCPKLFDEDFADKVTDFYECPMNRFDRWLKWQSANPSSEAYIENCDGATGLPVPENVFHECIISWSREDLIHEEENSILSRNGVVKIVVIPYKSRVIFSSANSVLRDEWNLINDWIVDEFSLNAPKEVANGYFSAAEYWWYDTNTQMFETAIGSIGIALAAAAVVILLSSKSLVLTLFSIIGIAFVLTSVTALMVGIGWTLGFLESVCFSILIGVSVDFVIHFAHAYVSASEHLAHSNNGERKANAKYMKQNDRTKFALIHMGPSVLAAAFTTIAGATIMLFTIITFFQKFAIVLFLTITQSILGSFVVFMSLTDCIGPSNPTYLYDKLMGNEISEETGLLEETAMKEIHDEEDNI